MKRRDWLQAAACALALPRTPVARSEEFASVVPGRALRFPDDEGSHPEFRTEWWYVTGWLDTDRAPLGFQVTFFRTRPHPDSGNPSRFNPRDILIAHAAVSEQAHGRLRHAERVARAGFGLADAKRGVTDVHIDHWRLHALGNELLARIEANDFVLDLRFGRPQPPLLQGNAGYSRKGPQATSASYYYSLPHLQATGRVTIGSEARNVNGAAWLDHEWSSEYIASAATGWDWTGINFDDGSALMVFRMRARGGGQFWAGGSFRSSDGRVTTFEPQQIAWSPQRQWISPRTGTAYPVGMQIRAGGIEVELVPLLDDQENDTRVSTGAVYWEGAVEAMRGGRRAGRGYLELTGYGGALKW